MNFPPPPSPPPSTRGGGGGGGGGGVVGQGQLLLNQCFEQDFFKLLLLWL